MLGQRERSDRLESVVSQPQKNLYLVVAVREVEASNVHSCVEHLNKHVCVPAGGSQGADDLGLALVQIDLLEDVLESDAA